MPTDPQPASDQRRRAARLAAAIACALALSLPAFADGKFYASSRLDPSLPSQRALLAWSNGIEVLVVQSAWHVEEGAPRKPETDNPHEDETLAWVVPVPSPPTLDWLAADDADGLFRYLDIYSRPDIVHVRDLLFSAAAIAWIVAAPVSLFLMFRARPGTSARRRAVGLTVVLVLGGLILFLSPVLARAGALAEGVEIIQAKRVGIHDVRVVRSDDPGALTTWLADEGFAFDASDASVLADAVEAGWCFVVALTTIPDSYDPTTIGRGGLVAPLVLTFVAEAPIYPLALTGTAGEPTEIRLHVLAPYRPDAGDAIPLRFASSPRSRQAGELAAYAARVADEDETGGPLAILRAIGAKPLVHSVFHGVVPPESMTRDLVLPRATDQSPFRERVVRW